LSFYPAWQTFGRRPIYLITFLIFFAANFGLSFTNTYWLLLLLRIVQATGACSAIAIGAGTIADVTERKERGGYMGYYAFAQYTGPAIGPVLGGILSQRWDYHATFFFLTALSGLVLIFMGFFLVETLHTLVGNGSLAPRGIYRSILSPSTKTLAPRGIYRSILSPSTKKQDSKEKSMKDPFKGKHDFGFMRPFKVFARPETSLTVLSFSLVYATYYLSAGSLSYLLSQEYGYDVIIIGVCYLPSGVGCAIGTVLGGKILDWDYQRALKKKPDANVKITRVRLQSAWIYMPGYSLSLLAYGWCIRAHTNIVAPLVFQFIGKTRQRKKLKRTYN
jgi:multidrug resistance protein